MRTWNKYIAEGIGTCSFVLLAAGSVLANTQVGFGTVGVALAHGLGLIALIYSFGHITAAHFNPAVTLAVWISGKIKQEEAVRYMLAQFIGAIVGAVLLKMFFANVSPQYYLGSTVLGQGVSPGMGIVIEAIFTLMLVWTALSMSMKTAQGQMGPVAMGALLAGLILVGGHLTGVGLNPARSFGPAVISGHWQHQYVYWIGPIIGSVLAAVAYHFKHLSYDRGYRKATREE